MNPAFLLGLGRGLQDANQNYFAVRGERLDRERQGRQDELQRQQLALERSNRERQFGLQEEELNLAKQERERNLIQQILTNLPEETDISEEMAGRIRGAGFDPFVLEPTKKVPVGEVGGAPDFVAPRVGTVQNGLQTRDSFQAKPFVPPSLKAAQDRMEAALAKMDADQGYRNANLDLRERSLDQRAGDTEARLRAAGENLDLRRQLFELTRRNSQREDLEMGAEIRTKALADAFKLVPPSLEERAGLPDPVTEQRRTEQYNKRLAELGQPFQIGAPVGNAPAPSQMVNPFKK